eukprot:3551398-Amphidinium_carterae.2
MELRLPNWQLKQRSHVVQTRACSLGKGQWCAPPACGRSKLSQRLGSDTPSAEGLLDVSPTGAGSARLQSGLQTRV